MINPHKITNYNRSEPELEEFLLFCILVAGKTAYIQAKKLNEFLNSINEKSEVSLSPFQCLKFLDENNILLYQLVSCKIGQYNRIHKAFSYIANNNIDILKCTLDDLEKIPGVGPKTSRFFMLHSRRCEVAILDTHILKWMRNIGYNDAPKSSPTDKKIYKKWESIFIKYCKDNDKDLAEFDLEIWNSYSKKEKNLNEN